MDIWTKNAVDVFAPTDLAGNPRGVVNGEAQVWGTEVQRLFELALTSGRVYATQADLYADLTPGANSPGLVLNDPDPTKNGIYRKNGATTTGSWTRLGDVPGYNVVRFSNVGAGSANAIEATAGGAVSTVAGAQIYTLNITANNTGDVTLNGRALLTSSGNQITANGLVTGMNVVFVDDGTSYRLLSDQASAAVVAAVEAMVTEAEGFRDEAQGFRNQALEYAGALSADRIQFVTVLGLLADNNDLIGYAGSGAEIDVAEDAIVWAAGYRYQVAAAGASDHHVTTAGGVKLYVLLTDGSYNVAAFGTVGDGSADDTDAIQLAADVAKAALAQLRGSPGAYRVTDTIQIDCDGDLSEMVIEADGALVSPVVRFGTTSGFPTSYKNIKLPRVRNNNRTTGEWGVGVGVELANCNTCTLFVPSVTEFEVGLDCGGYNSGFAYVTVTLGFVYSNKINLRLMPKDTGGWCNQNLFLNGRLGINTGDFTTSGYVGTRDIVLAEGTAISGGPNNNTFINTSIETSLLEYMIELNGSAGYNQFINCRYEGSNKNILFHTNTVDGLNDNTFIGGYQVNQIVFTFSGTGTSRYNQVIGARSNDIEATGYAFNIANTSGNAEANPHLQGFVAGENPLSKSAASTDWVYRLFANGFSGKTSANTHASVFLDWQNGRAYFGPGTAAPTAYIGRLGSSIGVNTTLMADADNTRSLGLSSFRWANAYSTNFRPGAGTAIWTSGTGDPEGVVTAPVGSLFTRTDGGAATTLYVKESGAGNTGWVAK